MNKIESNAVLVEPKYYIRYFIYEDFTRKFVRFRSSYWGDDTLINDLKFGVSHEMKSFHAQDIVIELLTVANRPVLKSIVHPKGEERMVQVYDVFFAPTEQWMLYKYASEEEISNEPILIEEYL